MACWTPDVALAPCAIEAASCPRPCRDEFTRLGGDGDLAAQIAAFEQVFLNDDAACRAPLAEVVSP